MIYTMENEEIMVQMNSEGGQLWSLLDKRSQTEHLWQGDPAYWSERSPTLFPICGRLKNGEYRLNGQTYSMHLHGFARDEEHRLVKQEKNTVVFRLVQNEVTLAQYPYAFQLDTIYCLEGSKLHYSFEVTNTGEERLPFSIGYHTGYRIPFDDRHTAEDYRIVFQKRETPTQLLEDGLLTGETQIPLHNENVLAVRRDMFPQSYVLEGIQSEYVGIVESKTGREVRVTFRDFPFLLLWSTQGEIPFICVEPWCGLPDDMDFNGTFLDKRALQSIASGECFRCTQTIEIIR